METGYETGSLEQQANKWLGVLRARSRNRYLSLNKLAQSIQQRSLSPGNTRLERGDIIDWLIENEELAMMDEFKNQQSDVIHPYIEDYITLQQQSSSQATTIGGEESVESVASHPQSAPNTMPGYAESLSEAAEVVEVVEDTNGGLAGYVDAESGLVSSEDDEDDDFDNAQIVTMQSSLDAAIAEVMGEDPLSPPPDVHVPGQGLNYYSMTPVQGPQGGTQGTPPQGVSQGMPQPMQNTPPQSSTGSVIMSQSNKALGDQILAGLLGNPQAMATAQALGFNLRTGQGVKAYKRYLIQRAQMLLMRRTSTGIKRAVHNTAKPRMYFNRNGPTREIRYT